MAQGPDMNPIEHGWRIAKDKIFNRIDHATKLDQVFETNSYPLIQTPHNENAILVNMVCKKDPHISTLHEIFHTYFETLNKIRL